MGRITVLKAENMSLGTGYVLAVLRTAAAVTSAAGMVRVKRVEISQNGTTTLQMIRGEIGTRDTAGTLTMTSTAPTAINPQGGPASGIAGNTAPAGNAATSGTNSSADSGGTYTQLYPFNFANTAGYLFKPAPDEEIVIPVATVLIVRLLAAPTTTTGWTVVVILEEE